MITRDIEKHFKIKSIKVWLIIAVMQPTLAVVILKPGQKQSGLNEELFELTIPFCPNTRICAVNCPKDVKRYNGRKTYVESRQEVKGAL